MSTELDAIVAMFGFGNTELPDDQVDELLTDAGIGPDAIPPDVAVRFVRQALAQAMLAQSRPAPSPIAGVGIAGLAARIDGTD